MNCWGLKYQPILFPPFTVIICKITLLTNFCPYLQHLIVKLQQILLASKELIMKNLSYKTKSCGLVLFIAPVFKC